MKRLAQLALVILAATLGGCCFPNREVSLALQDAWGKLRPATEFGITSNPSLDADSKETRMRLVVAFTELIEEMVLSTEEDSESEKPKE